MNKISSYKNFKLNGDKIAERDYVCGYCDRHTSSIIGMSLMKQNDRGFYNQYQNDGVYICTHCQLPSFFGITNKCRVINLGTQLLEFLKSYLICMTKLEILILSVHIPE